MLLDGWVTDLFFIIAVKAWIRAYFHEIMIKIFLKYNFIDFHYQI